MEILRQSRDARDVYITLSNYINPLTNVVRDL